MNFSRLNFYISSFKMTLQLKGFFLLHMSLLVSCNIITEGWEKFWTRSCEFSTQLGREKRSVEPNFENPEELFEYLYPLASLTPEDLRERQRSAPPDTLSVWLADLLELWESECYSRRKSRAEEYFDDEDDEFESEDENDDDSYILERPHESFQNSSSMSRIQGARGMNLTLSPHPFPFYGHPNFNRDNNYGIGNLSSHHTNSRSEGEGEGYYRATPSPAPDSQDYTKGRPPRRPHRSKSKKTIPIPKPSAAISSLLNGLQSDKATPTTTTTTTTTTTPAPTSDDQFFSSYGGDIEYFFPLLSFGVPFDGEITFLGFHGFKGLFPYR